MKHLIAITILIILSVVFLSVGEVDEIPKEAQAHSLPLHSDADIETMIRQMAANYGVDGDRAVRIAYCESKMGKYKYNWSGSSAKGVYMFIDKTWNHYCDGDVMNDEDNIKCFMKLYNKYPHWWICS